MQGPLPLPRVADNAIPNNWRPSLPRSLDVPSITDMVNIPRYIRCCDARDSIENTPSQKLLSGEKEKKKTWQRHRLKKVKQPSLHTTLTTDTKAVNRFSAVKSRA